MKFYQKIILLFGAVFLAGCGGSVKPREGIDPQPQVLADPNPDKSFGTQPVVKPDPKAPTDSAHVVIRKDALSKEFLLSVNILSQVPTPSFSSLQSRVVSFILRDRKVFMLDVTGNNVVGNKDNIPQTIIIAQFNILKETETDLEIDFNSGMNQIFTAGDMFASDDFKGEAELDLSSAKVNMSYLEELMITNSAFFIRQIAQIEGKDGAEPVEVRYQIKPYSPDPEFVPKISPGLDKVGYFEANPITLKDGSTRIYAMKWNEKKKIKFAISANTPEKYRKLFKAGLEYWNKALGENVIEVIQLEDKKINAPHFDINILQWVDYDGSGAAYADAHVDPRSGEVTSAQIFMPSAFFNMAPARRVRLMQTMRKRVVSLKGFKSAQVCSRNLAKDFSDRELGVTVTAEAMEKAVHDYAYEVVAHELGHVLGLRHNFAGNLESNYDFKDRKNLIMSYYQNQRAPENTVTSNSVMEYSRFEESALNGDMSQRGGEALTYDQLAIDVLYKNKEIPNENRPLFCTDSDHDTFADCSMSDAGRSALSAASGAYQAGLNSLPARILNKYIETAKYSDDGNDSELVPVADVVLTTSDVVRGVGAEYAKMISLFKHGVALVKIVNPMLPYMATKISEAEELQREYLESEVKRLGGLEALTGALTEDFETAFVEKFTALLEDPVYNSGRRRDGTSYSFTAEEKTLMIERIKIYAGLLKEKLILNEIKALAGENFAFPNHGQELIDAPTLWADNDTTYALASINLELFKHYVLSKTEDKKQIKVILKANKIEKNVELPTYKYSQAVRVAAGSLFDSGHKAIDWGLLEKNEAIALIEAEIALIGDLDKIDLSELDRDSLQWLLNNRKIKSALD